MCSKQFSCFKKLLNSNKIALKVACHLVAYKVVAYKKKVYSDTNTKCPPNMSPPKSAYEPL